MYNLAVEGEQEYFANGILVHNCDALSLSYTALGSQDRPTFASAGARQASNYTHGYR